MTKAPWIDYRPEIKVLDCTVRDGGLINNHLFEDGLVKAVYDTCIAAGVDYIELGYKGDKKIFAPDKHGAWKYCAEDDIRRIVGENEADIKISVMADAEKTDYKRDIEPREKSVIDIIRVATYIHQIPTAVDMIKDAHDKGYEVSANLMALSTVQDRELDEALHILAESPADVLVIVDSYGTLYSEQVRDYAKRFLKAAKGTGKEVGIHAHNNQQLAYANTIEAIIVGVNRLDATINGIGRGAGNCPMELLLNFLRNPKFNLRAVIQCIQDHFIDLGKEMEWGALIPYIITAHFNQHPRSAIEMLDSDKRNNYVEFYDRWNEA
ncbi:MAG: aldolase catalytic domain-containing protein [Sedimentisphaerales bacterium]|nr:aldolase catalytic domain-containing protein [Sedimentisphaerales bacterium]